jgi:hypothetical protein
MKKYHLNVSTIKACDLPILKRHDPNWCEKRHFLRHLCIKCIILPRQAQDNIGKALKKEWRFSQEPQRPLPELEVRQEVHAVSAGRSIGPRETHTHAQTQNRFVCDRTSLVYG